MPEKKEKKQQEIDNLKKHVANYKKEVEQFTNTLKNEFKKGSFTS